jgi:hypothetical protein
MRFDEIKKGEKDANGYTRCWPGKHAEGTKKGKNGGQVRACVPNESVDEGKVANAALAGAMALGGAIGYKHATKDPNAEPTKASQAFKTKYERNAEVGRDLKKKISGDQKNEGVAGTYNPEYDDEAGMADNNLSTLRRAVEGLDDLIDTGDNLPEWCQEKIAVAKSMLVAVWDYMESADDSEEEEDPEVVEMYEALEQLAEELAQRTNKDVEQVWETFEALDDQKLYETAAWRRKAGKNKNGGLNAKGVASYRRENPGSKLQTAVTTKPSKLKPGSKAAKRRKSFCARMSGVKGPMKKPNGKPTRKALALRKWNC